MVCGYSDLLCSIVNGANKTEYYMNLPYFSASGYPICPAPPCGTSLYYNGIRNYEWQCPCTGSETKSCYDGPAGTEGVGICRAGTQTCSNGWFGSCQGQVTPQPETCNDGIDNDCDGQIDEGCEPEELKKNLGSGRDKTNPATECGFSTANF